MLMPWMTMKPKRPLRTMMEELPELLDIHTKSHANTTSIILVVKQLVSAIMVYVHLRRDVLDHMDLGDLMEMMAHLVLMDPKDHLDFQEHLEKKEEGAVEDHQENQDIQENMSIIIVLEMVPREIEADQVNLEIQDDLDHLDLLDLKVMLACLLMGHLVDLATLEHLGEMEKMDVQDFQEGQDRKDREVMEISPRSSTLVNMEY